MSASNTGRGGASMSRPSSPSSCAVPSQHQSRITCRSVRSPSSDALADGGEPGERPARNRVAARAPRASRAWCASADSAPTHAPAQRFTWRAKHGPSRFSSPSAFQHSACSEASERSVSRACRFDVNGPYRPASSPASTPAAGTKRGGPGACRQLEHARFGLAAQRVVVRRQHRLDERRLAQQRADLARRLLEFDAPDLGREAKVGRRAIVGRKMRADALAQIRALADVERQRVEAVEEIDARRLGQRVERIRRRAAAAGSASSARASPRLRSPPARRSR